MTTGAPPTHIGSVPVLKRPALFLFHTPDLVVYGSKPRREGAKDPQLLDRIRANLRSYDDAVAYLPNQVFIGNVEPESLWDHPEPWYQNPHPSPESWGPDGRIVPQEEFYLLLKASDSFGLVLLEESFVSAAWEERDARGPLIDADAERIGPGNSKQAIEDALEGGDALPLTSGGAVIGCVKSGHSEDPSLDAVTILENFSAKATATAALRHVFADGSLDAPADIEYLLGCGEEAAGDRYQRGGGGMAKAVGEMAGCVNATGSDVKAFCCAPNHSIVLAASMISSGLFENIAVLAGGAASKLGMKSAGHLKNDMPILEDVLASMAVGVGRDDRVSPVLDLSCVGRHPISAGSSQRDILQAVVCDPLDRIGMKVVDVDRFSTELHNPELTRPQGGGDVPQNNYRMLGGMAALRHEIDAAGVKDFVRGRGLPGFSPTQGHIASAVPFLGHATRRLRNGSMDTSFFYAKGSFFLGRLTNQSDGFSFLLRRNPAVERV